MITITSSVSIEELVRLSESTQSTPDALKLLLDEVEKRANIEKENNEDYYDIFEDFFMAISLNPNASADLLKYLTEKWDMGFAVAQNPNCPNDMLIHFSKQKDEYLREQVAKNPLCPLPILKRWSKVKSELVRSAVAENENLPLELFYFLLHDKSERVRAFLASNCSCPPEILANLAKDESVWVKDVARVMQEKSQYRRPPVFE